MLGSLIIDITQNLAPWLFAGIEAMEQWIRMDLNLHQSYGDLTIYLNLYATKSFLQGCPFHISSPLYSFEDAEKTPHQYDLWYFENNPNLNLHNLIVLFALFCLSEAFNGDKTSRWLKNIYCWSNLCAIEAEANNIIPGQLVIMVTVYIPDTVSVVSPILCPEKKKNSQHAFQTEI